MLILTPQTAFAVYESLAFRTACNHAVVISQRPIKKRVLLRISRSSTASKEIARVQAEKLGTMSHEEFAMVLALDPCWQTFVLEEVFAERRWDDLIHGSLDSPDPVCKGIEWLRSMWEKVFSPDHPIVKTTATSLLALGTIVLAHEHVNDAFHEATQTLRAAIMGDKEGFPVRFISQSNGQKVDMVVGMLPNPSSPLPVHLDLKADKLTVAIDQSNDLDKIPAPISPLISQSNKVLASIDKGLTDLPDKLCCRELDAVRRELAGMSSSINSSSSSLNTTIDNYSRQSLNDLREARQQNDFQIRGLDRDLKLIEQAGQRATLTLGIREKRSATISVDLFSPADGSLSPQAITLQVIKIEKDRQSATVSVATSASAPTRLTLSIGKPQQLAHLGYSIVLVGVTREWMSLGWRARLNLEPTIEGLPEVQKSDQKEIRTATAGS